MQHYIVVAKRELQALKPIYALRVNALVARPIQITLAPRHQQHPTIVTTTAVPVAAKFYTLPRSIDKEH
jgi:hypothetical protein